jgi:hypothetical protein
VKESYWSPWTSIAIATVMVQVLVSELYQLMHGAGHVQSAKDVAFPRTGEADREGKPERVRLPGYAGIFYDILRDLPASLVEYAIGGQAPLPTAVGQLWNDETRFGDEIVDPADPMAAKLHEYLVFMAQQWEPISVSSYGRRAGTTTEKAESILGVSPAPIRVTDTPAEALLRKFSPPTRHSAAQAADAEQSRLIREGVRAGTKEGLRQAGDAFATGQLSQRQLVNVLQGIRRSRLESGLRMLPLDRALEVYERGSEQERGVMRLIVMTKISNVGELSPMDRAAMVGPVAHALDLPFTPAGEGQ